MIDNSEVVRVTYRWDDQAGVEAGWYCQSYDAAGYYEDSQKVWFPVEVDDFGPADAAGLTTALQEAFPNAEIVAL